MELIPSFVEPNGSHADDDNDDDAGGDGDGDGDGDDDDELGCSGLI